MWHGKAPVVLMHFEESNFGLLLLRSLPGLNTIIISIIRMTTKSTTTNHYYEKDCCSHNDDGVAWSKNTTMKNHVATFEGKTCHSKSPTSVKILLRITMFLQYFCSFKRAFKKWVFAFAKEFVVTNFHHFWKQLTEPPLVEVEVITNQPSIHQNKHVGG